MLLSFTELIKKYNLKPKGVLHLGASSGQESKEYHDNGVESVIWVEAIPEIYLQLVDNLAGRGYTNDIAINACITDKDGDFVDFHISNNEAQSSSIFELGEHKKAHPSVKYVRSIKLETKRVDTLLQGLNVVPYTFLNIDLQGAELLALKSMGSLINNFDAVYIEVNKKSTYIGCALLPEVQSYLLQRGFAMVELGDWVGDTWTDGFFLRSKV